jgi:hypothetical protein
VFMACNPCSRWCVDSQCGLEHDPRQLPQRPAVAGQLQSLLPGGAISWPTSSASIPAGVGSPRLSPALLSRPRFKVQYLTVSPNREVNAFLRNEPEISTA